MLLVHNNGKGFIDVSAASGAVFSAALGRPRAGHRRYLDNDGRVDVVVTTNDGPAYILHNETSTGNHWLTLKLVGHKSNRDAIGAEVKLTTAKGKQLGTVRPRQQLSFFAATSACISVWGPEQVAQSIEIRWPSGIRPDAQERSRRPGARSQ